MIYAVVLLLLLIILYLFFRIKSMKNNEQYFSRVIDQHVQEVESIYRNMRGIRHDYKNQLQVLKTHLHFNQIDELSDYLNQMEHELNPVDTIVQSGNVAIDAVINSKLSLAKNNGIQLDAKAIIPSEIPFSHLDLGILIGNLLSNAYEGALKCSQPFIRLYIAPIKGNLYISCTNSTTGKIENFMSTKIGTDHGLGINRINQIVSKYEGHIHRASEEGVFASEITLPLTLKNEPLVTN